MEKTHDQVFGHQPGLFLLFFTEMWERFSYYGMRALLTLFLVSEAAAGGWGWSNADALQLYALYTGLVYLTPILGGIIADKYLGYRNAVILGALLMTLGHGALALETEFMFYAGLGLLIFGNGFFKPNISSMVGHLYADDADRKDGAYTIFYMGINAGAFLGILLCGYIGEKVSWSYGFGLAGIFMLLGMIMFQLGQSILGEHGKRNSSVGSDRLVADENPSDIPIAEDTKPISNVDEEAPDIVKDRLIVIGILSFFTIFFWMAFEQAGGSMSIFALDFTERVLSGTNATIFFWANFLLTVVPLAIVTLVLIRLVQKTMSRIPFSNAAIVLSFIIVWIVAGFMIYNEFRMKAYEVEFVATKEIAPDEDAPEGTEPTFEQVSRTTTLRYAEDFEPNQQITIADLKSEGGMSSKLKILTAEEAGLFQNTIPATVVEEKQNETEVPASWFQILNSFFIIALAPLFSRIWESRFNPSAPVKFGIGLVLLGLGFGILALGSQSISKGAEGASVSMWWLIFAFLFHTMGELCVSPVGLSYVSKLAPLRLVGLMFGIWFGATAIANYLAGWTGSYIDKISEEYGLTTFFLIYTVVPIVAGLAIWALNGWLKKKMHGIQ